MEETINYKTQASNNKQYQNDNIQKSKPCYDLEDRTLGFAKAINAYIKKLPRSISNLENSKQLVRAAGSVGANYIEANEALSKKDFCMRVKISRKEAKESRFWLNLTEPADPDSDRIKRELINEALELTKILSAILLKCKSFNI